MSTYYSLGAALILSVLLGITSCKSETKNQKEESKTDVSTAPPEVNVLTRSMEFQCVDSIAAGWNKFVYENKSTEPHFILFDKYPEGKTIEDTHRDIVPPFDEGMALIMEGMNEEAMEAFGKLPEWFSEIVFSGGTGLISPEKTAITYVNLKPGYYIMECYVKMPDGKFHTSMGMTKELYVIDNSNTIVAPNADIHIKLSSEGGIVFEGDITKGNKVFAVHYEDQIVHENFVGHDISLVQLNADADHEELLSWMNWATPKGLMSASLPAGVTFLGGTNDAPAGSVLFFEADLKVGDYAFISEVPNAKEKGMFKTFTVSD